MLIQIDGNYWDGHDQKWVWPLWSQDSKIGLIIGGNNGINCNLVCLCKLRKTKSYFNNL